MNNVGELEGLSNFRASKSSFWMKAKQIDATSLVKVLETLREVHRHNHRNLYDFRYLGLVQRINGDDYGLSPVGSEFLSQGVKAQPIFDAQLEKFWLANPTNSRLTIDVFPVEILCRLIASLGWLSFDEYIAVVIWIHSPLEVDKAISLIREFRSASAESQVRALQKVMYDSGVDDLHDAALRLYQVLSAHSVFVKDSNERDASIRFAPPNPMLDFRKFEIARAQLKSGELNFQSWLTSPSQSLLKSSGIAQQLPLVSIPTTPSNNDVKLSPARDYEALAAAQRESGAGAEIFVMEQEQIKLESAGRKDLAGSVRRVSLESDSYGYDVLSFTSNGEEIHIEVKNISVTTGNAKIFISPNEIRVSQSDEAWCLAIVASDDNNRKRIWWADELKEFFADLDLSPIFNRANQLSLQASQYVVSFRLQ